MKEIAAYVNLYQNSFFETILQLTALPAVETDLVTP